jgi:hypothetical protein
LLDDFDPSHLDLVRVPSVWDRAEAIRTKRILNESGIPCFLGPDNLEEEEDIFNMNFAKGVDVRVRSIDNQRALGAIRHALDSDPQFEPEIISAASVRCPQCNCEKVVFQKRHSRPGADPDSEAKFDWHCDACGYHWSDDGVRKEPRSIYHSSAKSLGIDAGDG